MLRRTRLSVRLMVMAAIMKGWQRNIDISNIKYLIDIINVCV